MRDVREKVGASSGETSSVPVIVLANKCDVSPVSDDDQHMNPQSIDQFCHQHNIDAWFLTSAKENINIGKCRFNYLKNEVYSNCKFL